MKYFKTQKEKIEKGCKLRLYQDELQELHCGYKGKLCYSCKSKLSQLLKDEDAVRKAIDKYKWNLKDIDNKRLDEAIHYSGNEVFMNMHNEDLTNLKHKLGLDKDKE